MNVAEFGRYADTHPEIDRELDDKVLDRAQQGHAVVEGRMTSYLVRKNKIPALKVRIDAAPEVRAERVAGRENLDKEKALLDIEERDACDQKRYLNLYGVDPLEDKWYNIIIDNSEIQPEEAVKRVLNLFERFKHGNTDIA